MEAELVDENAVITNGRRDSDSVIGDSEPAGGRSGGEQTSSPQKSVPAYNPYQQYVATRPPEQSRQVPGNPPARPELRNYTNPNVRPPPQGYPPSWNRPPAPPPSQGDPRAGLGFRPNPPDYRQPIGPQKPTEYRPPPPDYRFQNPEYRPQGPPPPQGDYRLKTPPGPPAAPQTLKYRQPINPEYRPRPPPPGQPPQPRPPPDSRPPPSSENPYRPPPNSEVGYRPSTSPGAPEYRPPYRPQEYQRRDEVAADNGDYYEKQKKVSFDPNVQRSDSQLQSPTSERAAPSSSIIRRQSAWAILKEKLPNEPRLQNSLEFQQKSSVEYIRTTPGMSSSPAPAAYPPKPDSPKPKENVYRTTTPSSITSDTSVVEGKIPAEMMRMSPKPVVPPASRDSGRETPTRGAMTPEGRDSPTTMHYPPVTGGYRPSSSPQYMATRRDSNEKHILEPRAATAVDRGRDTPPMGVRPRGGDDDNDVMPPNRINPNFAPDMNRPKPRTPDGGRPESPAMRFENPMSPPPSAELFRSKPGTPSPQPPPTRNGPPMMQRMDSRASIDTGERFGEPHRSPLPGGLPPKPPVERVPTPRYYPDGVGSPTGQGPTWSPEQATAGYGPRPDYAKTPPRTPSVRLQNGGEYYPRMEESERDAGLTQRLQKPATLDLTSVERPGSGRVSNGVRTPDQKNGDVRRARIVIQDGDHDSGVDESTQRKELSTNGDYKSPLKSPTKIPGLKKSPSTRTARTPTRSGPKTPDETSEEKKKVPMNKIQVGAAPSPNLKTVRSKIGSLENTSYKPGGGKVKIESKKLDWKAAPRIAAKNDTYQPSGGEKKIQQQKLQWNAKSKVGSLENSTYKPGGGDKKIETIKLDFKDKAKPKIGSKENVKHVPGGGAVKNCRQSRSRSRPPDGSQIEEHKLEIKAQSKIGSMDNVKYKPGGGDKKIFDDKEYLKQMAATSGAKLDSEHASASQSRSKSTSRKSSRDRRSPIHLTPNGQVPKGLADGKSEKTSDKTKTPGSSPLSEREKGLNEPANLKSPTQLLPPTINEINTEPVKSPARNTPERTDNNDNKIESQPPDRSKEQGNVPNAVSEKIGDVTGGKKDAVESRPRTGEMGVEKSPRGEGRPSSGEQKPPQVTGLSLERKPSVETPPTFSQTLKDERDLRKSPGVDAPNPDPQKPASPALQPEKPPTPAPTKSPTPLSKPATPSFDQSSNPNPPTNPGPNTKPQSPQEQKLFEVPQMMPKDSDAKPGMPQPAPRSEGPKNIQRPPTGERRLDAQKQSPDFSPKFGIREPPSPKDAMGRKLGTPPGEGVRFDESKAPVKRETMSPGKRPDMGRPDPSRSDPRGEPLMRPKTTDATPKTMKNMENVANQRQDQYQTMRNLADKSRGGSPAEFRPDSVGAGAQEPPRSAPAAAKKSVVMPPADL